MKMRFYISVVCLYAVTQSNWFKSSSGRGVDPGGQGGGQTYRFAPPPPNNFDNLKNSLCNARIGLKIIVWHYKTINFYIKTLLNIHHFQFCGVLRAQKLYTATLRAKLERAENVDIFLTFAPPPLQSEKWSWILTDYLVYCGIWTKQLLYCSWVLHKIVFE